MKLAEALLLRADRNRSLEQLKQRIQVSARYQEGERPPEDARDLVAAASAVLDARGQRKGVQIPQYRAAQHRAQFTSHRAPRITRN